MKISLNLQPNKLLLQNIDKIFLISDLIKQESDKKKVALKLFLYFYFELKFIFKVMLEWKYLAMIADRLFFYIFGSAFIIGTFYIFMDHPRLLDFREPIQ